MTITLVFLALLMAAFTGWLLSQTFNVRPWAAQSAGDTTPGADGRLPEGATAGRVGLVVFLAVVASLFALSVSAYMMRMEVGTDWRVLPTPALLWANSVILVLASVFLQLAWNAARSSNAGRLRGTMIAGGVCTLAFVAGQYVVWLQLQAGGYYITGNPATAFFYLLTGLHALHLVGGLFAWGRTMRRIRAGQSMDTIRASVELCALYWHFLLLVWVGLFALLLQT